MEYMSLVFGALILGAWFGALVMNKSWKNDIKEKAKTFLPDTAEFALRTHPILEEDDGSTVYAIHQCVIVNEANASDRRRDLHSQVQKVLLDLKAVEEDRDELAADNEQLRKDLEAMEKKLAAKTETPKKKGRK